MSYLVDNEKCPICGEEFRKGWGLNCSLRCEDKKLEEEHRRVAPLMANYCLADYKVSVNVDCPNDLTEEAIGNRWGWTNDISKEITIPWLTLRNKEEFFDTVAHESGHVLAYERKFYLSTEKKVLKIWDEFLQEFNNLSPLLQNDIRVIKGYRKLIDDYYRKHKKIIDVYEENKRKDPTNWAHGVRYFYPAYQDCFNSLITSPYVSYNYNNSSSPKSFNEVRDYGKDYD